MYILLVFLYVMVGAMGFPEMTLFRNDRLFQRIIWFYI